MPFDIGLVGCGRISQSYLEAIQGSSILRLKAVCDVRQEAAAAVAEMTKATPFWNFSTYLKESGVVATIICTPPIDHKEIACRLLEAGQHVLCEKPLATTLAEGVQMMETARKKQRILMMASKFRYVEDVVQTKAILSSGMIGETLFYENCFSSCVDMHQRWNSDRKISGGGVLIDNGTHSVDMVRFLLGPIKQVKSIDVSNSRDLDVEDTITLSFITEDAIKGNINLSWNFQFDRNAYISVYGSEGQVRVNWDKSSYQYHHHPDWIFFGGGYRKIQAFQRQVENFVAAIQETGAPLISDTESLASVAVIDAAYRSLESGKWEKVNEVSL